MIDPTLQAHIHAGHLWKNLAQLIGLHASLIDQDEAFVAKLSECVDDLQELATKASAEATALKWVEVKQLIEKFEEEPVPTGRHEEDEAIKIAKQISLKHSHMVIKLQANLNGRW